MSDKQGMINTVEKAIKFLSENKSEMSGFILSVCFEREDDGHDGQRGAGVQIMTSTRRETAYVMLRSLFESLDQYSMHGEMAAFRAMMDNVMSSTMGMTISHARKNKGKVIEDPEEEMMRIAKEIQEITEEDVLDILDQLRKQINEDDE